MPILYESYAKSVERAVSAAKKATTIVFNLYLGTPPKRGMGTPIQDTTRYVGTVITLCACLYETAPPNISLTGKKVNFYHKLNEEAYTKFGSAIVDEYAYAEVAYTLDKAGKHTFYAEFPGDAEYEGCEKAAKTFARAR